MATTKKTSSLVPAVQLHRESGFRLFRGDDVELNPFSLSLIADDPLTEDQQFALLELAELNASPEPEAMPEPEPAPEPWNQEDPT